MIQRAPAALPPAVEAGLRRVIRLELWSLAWMASIVAVMYAATTHAAEGRSQAMRAALVEDMLSMVAPLAILLALRLRHRPPTPRFPYGFHNAVSIAFLCAAVALTGVGLLLLYEGVAALLLGDGLVLGTVAIAGTEVWAGWVMIAALAYSAVPPALLGRIKLTLAPQLHLKPLFTDARTNKADWMTAVAGIVGVAGIGVGWWWLDACAAIFIALDVLFDGSRNLAHAFGDLMGRRPEAVGRDEADPVCARVHDCVRAVPGVAAAQVRLREHGEMLVGEAWFRAVPGADVAEFAAQVRDAALSADWRVVDVVAMPVPPAASV